MYIYIFVKEYILKGGSTLSMQFSLMYAKT